MRIKRFEVAERFKFFNRTLQTLLFASACLMAFVLAWRSLPVLDITSDGRYSLTPETVAYLQSMSVEVEVFGSLALGEQTSLGGEHLREMQGLLARYAAVNPKLKVRWVDGFRAQAEYGFNNPYAIMLRTGDRRVMVYSDELYSKKDELFLGERALTMALWRLVNPVQTKVVVVVPPERWKAEGGWGYCRLSDFFASRNTQVEQIDPQGLSDKVIDADAIYLLGGLDKYTPEAWANLQRYINDKKGNFFVAVEETPGAEAIRFLYYNGVEWLGTRVDETGSKNKTPVGEILIRDFAENVITDVLRRDKLSVLTGGRWWALAVRQASVDVQAIPLLKSSATSIAKDKNIAAPFTLMLALSRKAEEAAYSNGIVCGGSDWLSNAYLTYRGNQALLESSYDWLLGKSGLQSIPARGVAARQIGLTSVQLMRIAAAIFACTLVLGAFGLLRWIIRPR